MNLHILLRGFWQERREGRTIACKRVASGAPEMKRRTSFKRDYLSLLFGFILAAGFVALAGFSFDRLLLTEGVPRFRVLLISNLLTGIVAGGLFLMVRIRILEKQRLLEQRLKKLAEMNHHIRNALQVVAGYAYQAGESEVVKRIKDSIGRIEWALREVLPKGWDLDDHSLGTGYRKKQ